MCKSTVILHRMSTPVIYLMLCVHGLLAGIVLVFTSLKQYYCRIYEVVLEYIITAL